jgi:hypothetical protein
VVVGVQAGLGVAHEAVAGVVDEHVDAAKGGDGEVDGCAHGLLVSDVEGDSLNARAAVCL